jgi:vancomycin resistance protein YoaR
MTAVARRIAASSGTLLARFETSYLESAESRPRAFNVELAVSAIDGVAILPGKTFSFNHVVGERTAAFGFEKATVIRDRMVAEGTGGGTCQVASTMHAAALLAGLDIAERVPHSRPSKYIRMGLDATVAYPRLDLKIHNPRPDRVVVRARAARGSLVVMLEADAPERPSVHLVSEILERTPFPQTVERDSLAAPDVVRVKEHGIPGYRVLRTRDIRRADGVVWRDQRLDVYPPTAQRLVAAPRVDVTALAPPEDDVIAPEEPAPASPRLLDDPALRPTHIQLHPARQVALDNVAS